ncbi:hypothetical protein KCU93_g240, partial [Aureobasidium melanogenum]
MTLRLSTMPLNITTGGRTDCCPTRLLDETVVEALCSIPCQMTHAVEGMKQKRPRCWQKTGPNRDKARRGRQGQKDRRSPNAEETIDPLTLRHDFYAHILHMVPNCWQPCQSSFDIDHICGSGKAFPTQRWNKNFYCKTRIALEFHDFGSLLIVLDIKHYDLQTFELC